jgi:hypothetical protein
MLPSIGKPDPALAVQFVLPLISDKLRKREQELARQKQVSPPTMEPRKSQSESGSSGTD